jgi:hypothetical protein
MKSTLKKTLNNSHYEEKPQVYEPKHLKRLEVVDDFIRNFLIRNGMNKTLNAFQVNHRICRDNGTNV